MDNRVREDFERDGFVVLKNWIPEETVSFWVREWDRWSKTLQRSPDKFNPVALEITSHTPPSLANIYKDHHILDAVELVFGHNIALYNRRFVVKDKDSRGAVPLHQDSCYHKGWLNKLSAFVPLSAVSQNNGGMIFWAGTHKYGFLGDAGSIKPEHTRLHSAHSPILWPGDLVLMHSCTWHESPAHCGDQYPDRVLADIHYQPSDDPTGVELLRGQWLTDIRMPPQLREQPFYRSRVLRMLELEAQLEELREGRA